MSFKFGDLKGKDRRFEGWMWMEELVVWWKFFWLILLLDFDDGGFNWGGLAYGFVGELRGLVGVYELMEENWV